MKVLLMGTGMQGKAALHDLAGSNDVDEIIAADANLEMLRSYVDNAGLNGRVRCEEFDAADPGSLKRLMRMQPDVAVDLLPSAFMIPVAREAIMHEVHLVNTFYVPHGLKTLDEDARKKGVTILPEFGLDPGIDLVMLGDACRSFDHIEEIYSYGGGIPEPEAADNPIRYKVSWTFDGVLEAYRRPSRMIHEGNVVAIDRTQVFSSENVHELRINDVGVLEAYTNGDAVQYIEPLGVDPRSLRAAGRYTMRWPGHCAFWKMMVDLHLLDPEPVIVDGSPVDRIRYLSAAIGPHIQYGTDERDLAIVRVDVIGNISGERRHVRYELVDRRDLATGLSAMSRTVGFTASIGAILIGRGAITRRGLLSPVRDVPYHIFCGELGRRGINIARTEYDEYRENG
jgi:saccharopine dehydrogenase-like NADP-dependent oxidoreductase